MDWLTTSEVSRSSGVHPSTVMSWYAELHKRGLTERVSERVYKWHPNVVGFMASRRDRNGRAIPGRAEVVERWFGLSGETTAERDGKTVPDLWGDNVGQGVEEVC